LRLQSKGDRYTGFVSYDGNKWTELGNVILPLKKTLHVGLAVCSGMPNATTIQFDQVSISAVK
jgi:regulation of enolase protein 1 (concanavalin A-like superfamily)